MSKLLIMLESLITSKTRLRLLIKFFISQANRGYLNGLAKEMDGSTNKIRKELNHLQEAGYIKKIKGEKIVEYEANTDHPLFEVLRKVVLKHLGLEDIVESVLDKMGNVKKIILVGDYANGQDTGRIEIFLVGKNLKMVYIELREVEIKIFIKSIFIFYLTCNFLSDQKHITLFDAEIK